MRLLSSALRLLPILWWLVFFPIGLDRAQCGAAVVRTGKFLSNPNGPTVILKILQLRAQILAGSRDFETEVIGVLLLKLRIAARVLHLRLPRV